MPAHNPKFAHLRNLEPEAGLTAVLDRIAEARADIMFLNKLAQSYRAKIRWKADRQPLPTDPDKMTDRQFQKFIDKMRDSNAETHIASLANQGGDSEAQYDEDEPDDVMTSSDNNAHSQARTVPKSPFEEI